MIKKVLTYALVVTTVVWSVGLLATPLSLSAASAGDLVKKAGSPAVYYLGNDNKLHVFTTSADYFTWYSDFSGIQTISDAEFNSYGFGANVFPRPGVKLVQFVDGETPWNIVDPKVYAVDSNGTLRHVTTAAVAEALYGANWESKIIPVVLTLLSSYNTGADIVNAGDFDPANATASATTIDDDIDLGASAPAGSGLTVALAPDTPAAGLAICTAIRVPFTKVNLTASADGDVTIDSLTVERTGVASDTNFGSLAIIDANTNVQIGLNQNLNSSHKANFNNDFTIPAGTTKSIILAGNMDPATATNCTASAGNLPSLALSSVTPKGNTAVVGALPISGNMQTINGVTIGQVTVRRGTFSNATSTTLKVGQTGYIVAAYKLTADSTENQKVEQIKVYNSGTASLSTDVENWKIYDENVTVVPTTVTVDGKYATLDFTGNPISIEKGKNKEITVKVDIVGGSTRTIKLVIYRTTDVVSRGVQFGQARVPAYTGTGYGGTGEVMSDNQFTISAGTLRVETNNTVVGANNVSYGDEVAVGSWNFVVAGEAVQITQLILTTSSSSAGSDTFDNVKLVDGSGNVLMGPSSSLSSGSVTFSETVEIPVGTNVVKAVVDIESTGGFATNDTFSFAINPTNITATGADTTESITATPGAAVSGATQTFKAASLSVTRDALPVNGNIVLGQQDALFGSWTFDTVNSGENIRITAIKAGNRAASTTNSDNLTLYDLSKTTQSACQAAYPGASFDAFGCALQIEDGSSGTTTFTLSDPMVLTKNTQTKVQLRGDVRTTAASYAGHKEEFMLYVTGTATDVITAVGTETNNTVTPTGTGVTGQTGALLTIASAGTLTVNTAASTANSLVAVNSTVELNRIKLTATNENIDIQELALCIGDPSDTNGSQTGDSDDVTEFKVYKSTDMSNPVITGNIGTGNKCRTFTLAKGTITVPKDASSGVELVIKGTMADIGTSLPGLAGADINIGIGGTDGIKGTGDASNTTATETYTASTSSIFKLVKGYPSISLNTLPSTSGLIAGSIVSDFTITNPTANPIAIYRLTFTQATATDANLEVSSSYVRVQSDAKRISPITNVAYASGIPYFSMVMLDPDETTQTKRAYRIGAGESIRLQLVANAVAGTDTTSDGTVSTYLSGDSATSATPAKVASESRGDAYSALDRGNFVWSDLWTNDAYDAASGNASASAQWWNGYLVGGLASASSTSQVFKE